MIGIIEFNEIVQGQQRYVSELDDKGTFNLDKALKEIAVDNFCKKERKVAKSLEMEFKEYKRKNRQKYVK